MTRWVRVVALACAACVKHAPPAAPVTPAPSSGAGWWCYQDSEIGGSCYRTQSDCEFDLDLVDAPGDEQCTTASIADCLSYTSNDGNPVQSCSPSMADCNENAQYLAGADESGQPRAQAGTIGACADTP